MVRNLNRNSARTAVLALLMATAITFSGAAVAQSTKDLKIGFVNVARLLAEAPQANAANRALENEFAPRQRDLVAKQKALKDRADKLTKDSAVMGAEQRRTAENDLRRDEREFARQAEELREDLNVRRNEALGKLRVDLLREVEGYARQNNYDVIVSDALFVSPAIDVTGQVLQALQSRFGQAGGAAAPAKP